MTISQYKITKMKAVQDEKFLEDAYLQPPLNMILQIKTWVEAVLRQHKNDA